MTETEQMPAQRAHDYPALLSEIESDPMSETLWERTVSLATAEMAKETGHALPEISEMVTIGRKLLSVSSEAEKYALLTQPATDGRLWYDLLLGPGNDEFFSPVVGWLEHSGRRWQHGLDVGTGTGSSLGQIARFCGQATGVDNNADMLAAARRRLGPGADLAMAESGNLPFADETFDLVVSNGLTVYLSDAETKRFAGEVLRTMKPGAVYMETIAVKATGSTVGSARELMINHLGAMAVNRNAHDSPTLTGQIMMFVRAGLAPSLIDTGHAAYKVLQFTKPG